MEDAQIVELYWTRSESAIAETDVKYGKYCRRIANNILHNEQDSEECVNDTWMRAWNSMPPKRPAALKAFLGTITRNLSLDRYDRLTAERRGMGQVPLALDELAECIPAPDRLGDITDDVTLADALDRFLGGLPAERRKIFMRRYWYFSSIKSIASDFGMSESKVKMSLLRSRSELRQHLEQEGIAL